MNIFAKLFISEKYGQLVAMSQENDEGAPEVRVFCQPPEMGVCSAALTFKDTDKGFDDRDAVFSKFDVEKAEVLAEQIIKSIEEMGIG